jgi:hypothetical protein
MLVEREREGERQGKQDKVQWEITHEGCVLLHRDNS